MLISSGSLSDCGSSFIARMGATSVPVRRSCAEGRVASIAAAARLPMTSTAGVACRGVIPGASLAAAAKVSISDFTRGMRNGRLAIGIQTVIASESPMPAKRSGATPTIRTGTPSSVIVAPRARGSRANKRSHSA
jgi:hypothetical protein